MKIPNYVMYVHVHKRICVYLQYQEKVNNYMRYYLVRGIEETIMVPAVY